LGEKDEGDEAMVVQATRRARVILFAIALANCALTSLSVSGDAADGCCSAECAANALSCEFLTSLELKRGMANHVTLPHPPSYDDDDDVVHLPRTNKDRIL